MKIKESFENTFKIDGETLEVFKNPDSSEMSSIDGWPPNGKTSGSCRVLFVYNEGKGDVYAWSALGGTGSFHDKITRKLGLFPSGCLQVVIEKKQATIKIKALQDKSFASKIINTPNVQSFIKRFSIVIPSEFQSLTEIFAVDIKGQGGKTCAVYVNPSENEMKEIPSWKEGRGLRCIFSDNGSVYTWDIHGAFHSDVMSKKNIPPEKCVKATVSKDKQIAIHSGSNSSGDFFSSNGDDDFIERMEAIKKFRDILNKASVKSFLRRYSISVPEKDFKYLDIVNKEEGDFAPAQNKSNGNGKPSNGTGSSKNNSSASLIKKEIYERLSLKN